jgi:hypothetical protein
MGSAGPTTPEIGPLSAVSEQPAITKAQKTKPDIKYLIVNLLSVDGSFDKSFRPGARRGPICAAFRKPP